MLFDSEDKVGKNGGMGGPLLISLHSNSNLTATHKQKYFCESFGIQAGI